MEQNWFSKAFIIFALTVLNKFELVRCRVFIVMLSICVMVYGVSDWSTTLVSRLTRRKDKALSNSDFKKLQRRVRLRKTRGKVPKITHFKVRS